MPSVFVPTPAFPTVPQLPGVPPLNLAPGVTFNLPTAVFADASGVFSSFGSRSRWGIYSRSGQQALIADAVSGVEYARDYAISDYPQTEGSFASYNKVQRPFQAKVIFLVGTNRPQFLNQAEAIAKSLDLFTVITPEISYPSANIVHHSYRRIAANGATLIQVEVWLQEVRIVNTGKLSQGQSSNSAEANQNGQVQATSAQTTSATAADGAASQQFSTPKGLATGLTPAADTSNTRLTSTIGSEFNTTQITQPMGLPLTEVPAGQTILAPDVAIGRDGTTQIVPIPAATLNPPT